MRRIGADAAHDEAPCNPAIVLCRRARRRVGEDVCPASGEAYNAGRRTDQSVEVRRCKERGIRVAVAKVRRRDMLANVDGAAGGARTDILDTARKLFAAKGYRATSVQDLADALGYGKASLYHYVRRKDDLLFALHALFMRRLAADLDAVLARDGRPADKLREVIVRFVELVAQYREDATIVNDEMRELSARNLKRVIALRDEYEGSLTRLVREGIAAGDFEAGDPHVYVRAILGMTNWCYRWLRPDGQLTPREVGEQMAKLVLGGMSKRRRG